MWGWCISDQKRYSELHPFRWDPLSQAQLYSHQQEQRERSNQREASKAAKLPSRFAGLSLVLPESPAFSSLNAFHFERWLKSLRERERKSSLPLEAASLATAGPAGSRSHIQPQSMPKGRRALGCCQHPNLRGIALLRCLKTGGVWEEQWLFKSRVYMFFWELIACKSTRYDKGSGEAKPF